MTIDRSHLWPALALMGLVVLTLLLGCDAIKPLARGEVLHDLGAIAREREASETTVLDFADPAVWRHLISGWSRVRRGPSWVWGLGEESLASFVVHRPRHLRMTIRCQPFPFPDGRAQVMTVELNGREVLELEMKPRSGVQTFVVDLPADSQVEGENLLRFRYRFHGSGAEYLGRADKRPMAVAWHRIEIDDPAPVEAAVEAAVEAPAEVALEPSAEGQAEADDGLRLPYGQALTFHLSLPAGSRLVLKGLRPGAGGRLEVEIEGETEGEVDRHSLARPRRSVRIPISRDRPGLYRLTLAARIENPEAQGSIALGGATVEAPVPLLARVAVAGTGAAAEGPPAAERPNIVLYVVDTLRADHLGCYGYARPVSPRIDAFAAEGLRFERATSQAPWTRPSMASMMTGRWPLAHGLNDHMEALPQTALTLAEILGTAGYRTVAFVANPQVGAAFGFDQGFDEFHLLSGETAYLRDSSQVLDTAVGEWLESRESQQPFFLWVHPIDPHAPYTPPAEYRARFAADVEDPELTPKQLRVLSKVHKELEDHTYYRPDDLHLGSIPWMVALEDGWSPKRRPDVSGITDLYDAEIAFNDFYFGRLLDRLREAGVYDDSLILFTSDHGEEFDEHGHWQHGMTLHGEALTVPLLIRPPGGVASGGEVGRPHAGLVDLVPTVVEVAGATLPDAVEGSSLLGEPAAQEAGVPPVFSFVHNDGIKAASVTADGWKLIYHWDPERRPELFDLAADPDERVDRAAEMPVRVGYLVELLWRQRIAYGSGGAGVEAVVDADTAAALEALGYVTGRQ